MSSLHTYRQGSGLKTEEACPDERFANPDNVYAPHAFWFWNGAGDIGDPAHFARMASEMSRQGFNPGYVHARHYKAHEPFWLSDDWYACFQAAVESAEQAGAHMTYTMGDPCFPDKYLLPDHPEHPRFPVGGTPLPSCPELKSESLCWTVQNIPGGATAEVPECFFAVAARLDAGNRILSSTLELAKPGRWTAPADGNWRVYAFAKYHEIRQYRINFLDRRITEPWLKLENTKYEQLFSRHFGKTMRGVFFDLEGSFGYKIAWSEDFAKDYLKRKGVDIRLRMPLLVEEDAEGLWAKVRWDWFDVAGHVYVDCLFNPLDQWCRDRKMFMTCHFWEEGLFLQAAYVANFMDAQRACSMPGTDALFQTIHDPRYFKETQSVCEFEGRPFMCEMLGIAGWHCTPTEMKVAANSAIAHGLTHLVLHGVDSSRDLGEVSYPPDFFDWNPYWRHFHLWTDFARRACHVNDHGRLAAETLLLCPMDSVWALIGDAFFDRAEPQPHIHDVSSVKLSHASEIMAIDEAYSRAMQDLFAARVDHLVADSHYLDKMVVDGSTLSYGSFAFKSLVLPPLKLLPLAVARRIVDFARAGGQVYALGVLPDASAEHGVGDPELKDLMEALRQAPSFVVAEHGLAPLIAGKSRGLEPCITFESGAFPLVASRRVVNGRSFFWLANNEIVRHECVLRIRGMVGAIACWNCETGEITTIPSEDVADGSRVSLIFEPCDAFWLVIDPAKSPLAPTPATVFEAVTILDAPWAVKVDPDDQPPLAQHRLAAPDWLLSGEATRPLESWLKWDLRQFSGFVDYTTLLRMDRVAGDETIDLGAVKHMAEVWVNGKQAGARLWPPYRFPIGKFLRSGENRIRVRVGNLIVNAVTQYENYNWKWHEAPTDETLDAGLFGPVAVCRPTSLGDDFMPYFGYSDCVKLENKDTRVIVSGACGGRVLEYSLNGINALLLDPAQAGWTYVPGKLTVDPCGGRMDIGPEYTMPPHPELWLGTWKTECLGPLAARMTSVADKATGVQLVRDLVLAPDSSRLKVTQTIRNVSDKSVRWFHWGRTFAPPGGLCVIPLGPGSRFPGNYAMYELGHRINIQPQDDHVVVENDCIFITGLPRHAKLGFDSCSGKLAYLTRDNLLFTKVFPVYPDRGYGEPVPISLCICYQKAFCELGPIGPQQSIAPGGETSYTETWSLASSPFPADGSFDFNKLRNFVK